MKNKKINQILFVLAYALIMASDMFSNFNVLVPFLSGFSYTGIGLLILLLLIQSDTYKISEIISLFFFTLLIIGLLYTNVYKNIIYIFLLVLTMKNIDFRKFIKSVFIIRLVFFAIIVGGHFLGMTNDLIMIRESIIRNSMGFAHPNRFGACIFQLSLEYIFLRDKKLKIYDLIFLFIFALFMNNYSDSRAFFVSMIVLIILSSLLMIKDGKLFDNKILKFSIVHVFTLLFVLSLIIMNLYLKGNDMILQLDKLMTGRIRIMAYNMESIGLSLFGNDMTLVPDNAYIQILIRYGVLFTCVIILFFSKLMKKLYDEKKYFLVTVLFVYCIYGLMEAYIIRISYNAFLVLFGTIIYERKRVKENEKSRSNNIS